MNKKNGKIITYEENNNIENIDIVSIDQFLLDV